VHQDESLAECDMKVLCHCHGPIRSYSSETFIFCYVYCVLGCTKNLDVIFANTIMLRVFTRDVDHMGILSFNRRIIITFENKRIIYC
jgi:hypothetical protein